MRKRVLAAVALLLLGTAVSMLLGACGAMNSFGKNQVTYTRAGGFIDKRGQAKIVLFTYNGHAKYEDIKSYTETLGCGMLYAYFYPADTSSDLIPTYELQNAKSFTQAQDVLFKGAGYAKWHFASQCIGFIPTVTDCRETPLSTNCR